MTERVCFFSSEDQSIRHYADRAEALVLSVSKDMICPSINDAFELYHAMQIMKCLHWKETVSAEHISCINEKCNLIPGIIIEFIRSIDLAVFPSIVEDLEFDYFGSLMEFLAKYMLDFLKPNTLESILKADPSRVTELLKQEKLVKRHSQCVADFLREYPDTAELLLSEFAEEHRLGNHDQMFFPKCLTIEDRNAIISEYIDRDEPNINYVRLAMFAKSCNGLSLNEKIKYKAKKKAKELNDRYCNEGTRFPMEIKVQITDDTPIETVETSLKNTHWKTVVNTSFLLATTDTELIHCFAFLFKYYNKQGFIDLVSKKQDLLLPEKLGLSAKNSYPDGMIFQRVNSLAVTQISAVNELLRKNGRSIEQAIKYYYEIHLRESYGYPSPPINVLLADVDYHTKLKVLLPEMEAVVKHYNVYVDEREIDLGYLAATAPVKITDCKSLLEKKNVTLTENATELKNVMFHLFSDQSMLAHVDPYKEDHYTCLFDLMREKKEVLYQNYEKYQLRDIDYLIDNSYLNKSEDGLLTFSNEYEILVLYYLYHLEVCSYWFSPFGARRVLDEYINKGWCKVDDNLFAPPEQDWLSYYLNNEKFVNAKGYRNQILHGTPNIDEKSWQYVYGEILMLFVTILLKIDQDLAIAKELEKNSSDNSSA